MVPPRRGKTISRRTLRSARVTQPERLPCQAGGSPAAPQAMAVQIALSAPRARPPAADSAVPSPSVAFPSTRFGVRTPATCPEPGLRTGSTRRGSWASRGWRQRRIARDNWSYREQKIPVSFNRPGGRRMLSSETTCNLERSFHQNQDTALDDPLAPLAAYFETAKGAFSRNTERALRAGRADLRGLVPTTFLAGVSRQRRHHGGLRRRHGPHQDPGHGAPLRVQHRHPAQGATAGETPWTAPPSVSPCSGCTGAGAAGRRRSRD